LPQLPPKLCHSEAAGCAQGCAHGLGCIGKGFAMSAMKTNGLLRGRLSAPLGFARSESGTMVVLSLFVFVAMLLVAGIAIDMMRHENERVRMQGAADRAVIAATMLRPTPGNPTPQQILTAYMTAEGLGAHVEGRIQVTDDPATGRTVTVVPAGTMPTLFMRMLGIDALPLASLAQANEAMGGAPDVEMVMVLDVSGSMGSAPGGGPRRIERMRQAASNLADQLMRDQPLGRVAITLVPYDSWVLPSTGFLNFFNNQSGSGACMDFEDYDLITDTFNRRIYRSSCPTNNWRQVRPFLHDAATARAVINDLRHSGNTSTDLGVRVGAMFFDPTINPAITQLIANGSVDPIFADRPFAWDRPDTLRVMLLLTDGESWAHGARRLGTSGLANRNRQIDANTIATCIALRERGVTIYAVAFEAPIRGVSLMQQCASSENHFFNTSGAGLGAVFEGIGNHIQTQALRLTR